MTKHELIDAIASKTGLTKAETELTINAAFACMEKELAKKSGKVVLDGVGTLYADVQAERKGFDIKTKKTKTFPAKQTVRFKASPSLKDKLNK